MRFSASDGERRPDREGWLDIAATIIFWIAILVVLGNLFLKVYSLNNPASRAEGLKFDFAVFWAAAKLALAGQPLATFDPQALFASAEMHAEVRPANFVWLYPASFLVVLVPFGAIPLPLAFPAFIAVSATALALAARTPASVLPGLWRLMLASPMAVIGCLFIGQTSVLWTAGLIAALWAMRGGKAAAAGLAIALLTMKPQLGLLIPVALIAARQWAVIGWACGFTLLLVGAATAVAGPGYWPLFLDALGNQVDRVADGTMRSHLLTSFYGFSLALGAGHGSALALQLAFTAGLAAIIGWVWSRRGLGDDLKYATLCAAIPLATPYALYYEMTILLAAALFLIRDGFGRRLAAKAWLLVLWLGHAPALFYPDLDRLNIALYATPVMLITLAICVARVRRRLSTVGGDGPAASPCPAPS